MPLSTVASAGYFSSRPGFASPRYAPTPAGLTSRGGYAQAAPRTQGVPVAARVVQPSSVTLPVTTARPVTNSVPVSTLLASTRALASSPSASAVVPRRQASEEKGSKSEFSISVGRAAEMQWGLVLDTIQLRANKIIIDSIQESSVFSEWNKWSEAKGDRQLLVGDQVMEINGKVDAQEMMNVCKTATVLHIRVRSLMSTEALEPWLLAAKDFVLNSDFDISDKLQDSKPMSLLNIMNIMKKESAEKNTIQAIGDKIILSRLLDNMKVPQMPLLFNARLKATLPQVQEVIDGLVTAEEGGDADAFDIVVKPTHLSNGAGALIFSKEKWVKGGYDATKLLQHMEKYLAEKPDGSESEALKSLIPGFIVQPCYKSCLEFKAPLEMRVITLWGKARLGIWWWGRQEVGKEPAKGQKPQRTAWLVRKNDEDLSNSEDSWEVLHEHGGGNVGFEKALALFMQAMPDMATAAESIAKAIGAPFLRSDFFVGSEKYGIRLNEVAYGSGVDCRRKSEDGEAADDANLIARILKEGFKHCKRSEAKTFMETLGAEGANYSSMVVQKLEPQTIAQPNRPRLPTTCLFGMENGLSMVSPAGADECETGSHFVQALKATAASPAGLAQRRVVQAPGPSRLGVPQAAVRLQSVTMQPNSVKIAVPAATRMTGMPGSVRVNASGIRSPGVQLGSAKAVTYQRALAPIAEVSKTYTVPGTRNRAN